MLFVEFKLNEGESVMRDIILALDRFGDQALLLGRVDENRATRVQIDLKSILSQYPDAIASLTVKQPGRAEYPATVKQEGGILTWEITRADIGDKAGSGQAQITIRDADGTVIKTAIACTRVSESLGNATAPAPDPVETWIDKATGTLADVERAGNAAQAVADEVQRRLDNGDFVGPQGPKGDRGEKGDKGDKGDTGAKGEPGKDAVIDTTLTQEGEAADAAATGKRLAEIKKAVAEKADKARQNILIGSETGNPVSVSDAFSAPLCGLTVYGKSTQDGTPSPDNPAPIVSAGDSGSVAVKVTGKNLFAKQEYQTFFINNAGTAVGLADGNISSVLQVPTGAEYYITRKAIGTKFRVAVVNDLPTKSNTVKPSNAVNGDTKQQIKISATSKYMVIQCEDESAFEELMVSLDSSTAYSPYREQLLTLPTPNGLPGIPVASGGNYTDSTGQQWVCDEINLERGVKVQRVDKAAFDSTKTLVEQNAILATPVETPLTPAELTAYKALTTYAPDTVAQASDGAGLKPDYQRDVNIVIKNLEDAIASMTTT